MDKFDLQNRDVSLISVVDKKRRLTSENIAVLAVWLSLCLKSS